jgi:integrase
MAVRKRRFGRVRRLSSGRWQARYRGPDGKDRAAPSTFERKRDAERWLALVEAEIVGRSWRDPAEGKVPLQAYAETWIRQRGLRPRTVELYQWLLGRYITPHLGRVHLIDLDTSMIRSWRAALLDSGVSPSMAAKAYRLLRAVLMTAAEDDELIPRNPCRVRGADRESASERPVLTVPQVFALADRMPNRHRALVLVTAFASLRWGEVTALRRADVDLGHGTVSVRAAYTELRNGALVLGPPKSRAGSRTVSVPVAVVQALTEHMTRYVGPGRDALVFSGPKGAPLRRSNFNKLVRWAEAVEAVGAPGLHFHDLRHTGATLAARTGTALRDLMQRIGHDSTSAAIRYQHASREADEIIAAALDDVIRAARGDDDDRDDGDDGAAGALVPSGT